jgi:hypothetical protein
MTTLLVLAAVAVVATTAVIARQLRFAVASDRPVAGREPRTAIEPAWTAFVRGL